MTTVTNYLKLRNIPLTSTQWFTDFNYNISRIDLIGKHVRIQTGAGQTMALRAELLDGTLAEAIRIVPEGDTLSVYLGRTGKGDKVVIAATALYSSISLSNQQVGSQGYKLDLGASWSDEDVGGDDMQNVSLLLNTKNNLVTVMEFPAASAVGVTDDTWLGSAAQLELDSSGSVTGQSVLKFTVTTKSGTTKNFIVPCYTL
jgi:hypothetical protein